SNTRAYGRYHTYGGTPSRIQVVHGPNQKEAQAGVPRQKDGARSLPLQHATAAANGLHVCAHRVAAVVRHFLSTCSSLYGIQNTTACRREIHPTACTTQRQLTSCHMPAKARQKKSESSTPL
ncbi:unnamed protein product, partial [Ectocarpus sp. 12 AP-2014]